MRGKALNVYYTRRAAYIDKPPVRDRPPAYPTTMMSQDREDAQRFRWLNERLRRQPTAHIPVAWLREIYALATTSVRHADSKRVRLRLIELTKEVLELYESSVSETTVSLYLNRQSDASLMRRADADERLPGTMVSNRYEYA